ncbi:T9SS C-terminal target domain-containing protein [candidate division KSB1 bacterium]
MKNIIRFTLITTLILFMSLNNIFADKNPVDKPKGTKSTKAEACIPASGSSEININNVRTRINTGGDMWWDFEVSRYEIPKGSRKTSMFSASLWIGGLDVNGQLKLAALRYRQVGNDYWPGPLTTDGTAAVNSEVCQEYDRHFPMTRADVEEFLAAYNNPLEYPDYVIPKSIIQWPAHGDVEQNQSYFLAPFFDRAGDGDYDPYDGDFPYYDFDNSLCGDTAAPMEGIGILVDQILKGDQTLWWVFNDKGNSHTETQGQPIGMEIRAQAFAFATNDEINNMTFYSYEIINRSTFTLTETYFSQWVDTDLGYARDDFVGCDVERGLGYCYNGKAVDGNGKFDHYGNQPPAVGVDFFQGPYMDPDNLDNPKYDNSGTQLCDESINGVNFQDGIVDNERFGMRRFVYHNNTSAGGNPATQDPQIAIEYYNFLRGIWKDGEVMKYGGNAHPSSASYGPECAFMFPGDTDPCGWGVNQQAYGGPEYWTEETANNLPEDRRFMQSAGPFILKPGAVNYITVGIPWARAASGGAFESVELLRVVDDKCQALFDNCFKVLDGPDAPDLIAQELDREIILYIQNRKSSNNYREQYLEFDPIIPPLNSDTTLVSERFDSLYRFEGYQIYQLKDATVSIADLDDPDLARLVAQCDIENYDRRENPIAQLVNFYYSDDLEANVPFEEVNGLNEGISHSFRITDDQFAEGDKRLINHKQYYFIAIAYGYNEYMKYSQDPGNQDPGISGLSGQKQPYKAGRKSPTGSIKSITVIPHNPVPENGGTVINAQYGAGPKIKRIEGQGNGGMNLDLTQASIDKIMSGGQHRIEQPEYKHNRGPINVKVVDPLNVKGANYTLRFTDVVLAPPPSNIQIIEEAKWELINNDNGTVYVSDTTINIENEQLFIDEGLGISIKIEKISFPGDSTSINNGYIEATIVYADSSRMWLAGVPDADGTSRNWIRCGTTVDESNSDNNDYNLTGINAGEALDPLEFYEKILGGTFAPYRMSSIYENGPAFGALPSAMGLNKLAKLASVDIVLTKDKSKWTRTPVFETCDDQILAEGGTEKFDLRSAASLNINGEAGITSSDPTLNSDYIHSTGMSWFPGYAINVETGERLNMAFGEDSWLAGQNGRDMLFNPTSEYYTNLGEILWGGKHFVYVFGHNNLTGGVNSDRDCPAYDGGQWVVDRLTSVVSIEKAYVFANAMWVGIPMAISGENWLSNKAKIRIRVAKPYQRFYSTQNIGATNPVNDNYPLYTFSTHDLATVYNDNATAKSALDIINVVPNPYYAYSGYETNQLDSRVKITNLPDKCTITIYAMNGNVIRQYTKDDNLNTFVDWDLKNFAGIPIASGIYLIHVDAPNIGERVLKWFGTMRPTDLNAF